MASRSTSNQPVMADLHFAMSGKSLVADYRRDLLDEVQRCLPWFESQELAGIHPLRCANGGGGTLLLSARTRLVLRIPAEAVAAAGLLDGSTLRVGGSEISVGAPVAREILPFGTLYAYFVASPTVDELAFVADTEAQLKAHGVVCELVCGRPQTLTAGCETLNGFSLMLHGLKPCDSALLQAYGLGPHRKLGCGLLVPHKSVAAVGA